MPTATGSQLLDVLMGLGALVFVLYYVLGLAEKVKAVFFARATPASERFVTHGEFAEFRSQLLEELRKLDGYTREQVGGMRSALQTVLLKIERLVTLEEVRHGRVRTDADTTAEGP